MAVENSSVISRFATLNTVFQSADANTGEGALGWWPDEGVNESFVIDLNVKDATMKLKDGQTVPAMSVQFIYQLMQDPGAPDGTPRRWNGAPFLFPADLSAISDEKTQTRIRMETERIKGHLKVILRRDPKDLPAALTDCAKRVADASNPVAVRVNCQYDKNPVTGKTYKKEFIQSALSQ